MNNQIKIIYNPYEKTIQYQYRNSLDRLWDNLDPSASLASEKFTKGTLQNLAEDIVEQCKTYCTDGRGVDLYFSGTDLDWADLKGTVARCAEDRIICCDQMEKLCSPNEVLPKIQDIFGELSAQLDSLQDSKIREPIDRYRDTVKPGVNLVVTGTYSAGKSSFINALVGEELLPTSSDPTTAKIYKISSLSGRNWFDTVIRFRYRETDVELRFNEDGYYMQAEELQRAMAGSPLKDCLDKIKKDFRPSPAYIYKMIEELNSFQGASADQDCGGAISEIIEIDTPFYRSTLPLERYQFVIYDTPGPNSAKHEEHREVLERALKGQTNGLPILVTDPDNKDSKDLAALKEELSNIQALDISNIMIVFNKADQKGEKTLEKIKNVSCAALEGAEKRGFMLSSLVGLGAKKEDMEQCISEDAAEIFERIEPSFLEDGKKGKKKLYQYNVLPQHLINLVNAAGEDANSAEDDRQKLLHNSGLWAVEYGICDFAARYAGYNKCQQAKENLSEAIEIAKEELKQKMEFEKECSAELQEAFDDKRRRLLIALEGTAETKLKALNNSCVEKRMAIIIGHSLDKDELASLLVGRWKQYKKEEYEKKVKDNRATRAKNRFESYVKYFINTQLSKTRDDISRVIDYFLEKGINEYKTACIRVVNESDAISEEERSFLSEFIMNCPVPNWRPPQFKSEDLNVVTFRFLFRERSFINQFECAEKVIENINNAIATENQKYGSMIEDQLRLWKNNFIEQLMLKLADFNAELKDTGARLKKSQAEVERLSNTMTDMEQKLEDIQQLFQFPTEIEKEQEEA